MSTQNKSPGEKGTFRLKKPKNQAAFWLYVTVGSTVLWGLGGLLGALGKGEQLASVAAVLSGVSSCCILAGALLCLGERRGRETPGRVQRIVELQLTLLMLVMLVVAEIVALRAGDVSLSPMATMGMLALIFCVWIAGPKFSGHRRFETVDILKIIVLGTAATWLIAKFLSLITEAMM
ncbi:MAG: hypothetical protein IJV40_01635 [Oscillospiraceae bacterium]|nr:hypothetical protein [Oscillospiraceae bacterium]